jgi:hypothetical protein
MTIHVTERVPILRQGSWLERSAISFVRQHHKHSQHLLPSCLISMVAINLKLSKGPFDRSKQCEEHFLQLSILSGMPCLS